MPGPRLRAIDSIALAFGIKGERNAVVRQEVGLRRIHRMPSPPVLGQKLGSACGWNEKDIHRLHVRSLVLDKTEIVQDRHISVGTNVYGTRR